jgi:hypothetical protein
MTYPNCWGLVAVQVGKTTIQRNSRESNVVAPDNPSYRTLLRKVGDALEGKDQFYIDRVSMNFVKQWFRVTDTPQVIQQSPS